MSQSKYTCPMPRAKVVDTYFMEHRAKLLDIAAFLDRIDRASPAEKGVEIDLEVEDFRVEALRRAARILNDDCPGRVERILELFSDPSKEPIASAAGMKGASGACKSL